jgi:DNA-formamidopyrimidine glycosylase
MAEGHTLIRWAGWLKPLIGQHLDAVQLPRRFAGRAEALVGEHVTAIETRGKHLLVHLSGGETIHCHAMMYGSWQVGRPGMALTKAERQVRVRLRTAEHEAVFYNGPVTELLTPEELATHERLRALGPDIMSSEFDRDEAWRRIQHDRAREVGDAVLDQTIVAGIGNVYKSEGLFLAGINPHEPTGRVNREEIETLWKETIPLMWYGVDHAPPIVTLPEELRSETERNWVYQRSRRPCFRCDDTIRMTRQGEHKRSSFHCPTCQPLRTPKAKQTQLPGLDDTGDEGDTGS